MPVGFPDYYIEKPTITPLAVPGAESFLGIGGAGFGAAAWPSANLAFFLPITITETVTVKRLAAVFGNISGNWDAGLYDADGVRLASLGLTALVGSAGCYVANIADTTLIPGRYYLGIAVDNTTATVFRLGAIAGQNQLFGVKEQATACPLPATAAWTDSASRAYIPVVTALLSA